MLSRSFAVAVAGLAAVWFTAPAGVPLYDGIGFPDEPYRYVAPSAGYRHTPPPTGALGAVLGGDKGSTADLEAMSAETGPQVEVFVSQTGLTGPPYARSFQVRADPIAPGAAGVDANAYRVRAGCSSQPPTPGARVAPDPGCAATIRPRSADRYAWIALRATSAREPSPAMLYRPIAASSYRVLPTDRGGRDIFATALIGPGDYALSFKPVAQPSTGARPAPSHHRTPVTVIVLLVVLAGFAVLILGIRFTRTRA